MRHRDEELSDTADVRVRSFNVSIALIIGLILIVLAVIGVTMWVTAHRPPTNPFATGMMFPAAASRVRRLLNTAARR